MNSLNPNAALILLLVGLLGIYAEFCFPGKVLPGVIGSSLTIYAIFTLARHPISWLGMLLIITSYPLFALDAAVRARGGLILIGAISLTTGAFTLIDSPDPALRIHAATALAFVPFSLLTGFLFSAAYRARSNKLK